MSFRQYRNLKNNEFKRDGFSLVPIRDQDKELIRLWRNEQMFHLRQSEALSVEKQETYFKEVVSKLFEQNEPNQLLFSYLQEGELIGYGGLVHINWEKRTAEISFLMKTSLENQFVEHWLGYLKLIEKVAFIELDLAEIYTYSYNLRPKLYVMLDKARYSLVKEIKNDIQVNGKPVSSFIHSKVNPYSSMTFIPAEKEDVDVLFEWANDPVTRSQSFNSDTIDYASHVKWFQSKLEDQHASIWMVKMDEKLIGTVKFDFINGEYLIGASLDVKARGQGFAAPMLRKACEIQIKEGEGRLVIAKIKASNIASIKSFEAAGFKKVNTTSIEGRNVEILNFTI